MKPFPKIHDRYVGRVVLGYVLAVWLVLVGLDFMLGGGGLMAQLDDLGKGSYGFADAFLYSSYTLPRRLYTLFPTAAVIGALLGLGQLAASSELTALRASGLSRRRLSLSVALTIALLTGLMTLSGETLGPWGERKANSLKAAATSPNMIVAQYSGLWAREGDMFLNARSGEQKQRGDDRWLELRGVRLFEFEDDGRLKSIANAEIAEHRPGGWLLRNVERTYPYFHDGSVWELDKAVRIMGQTQLGIQLNDQEVADITAFLKSLTGTVPTAALQLPILPASTAKTTKPDNM